MINENLLEIINADKAAREKVAAAAKASGELDAKLEEARAKFEKKYGDKAKAKIDSSAAEHEKILKKAEADYKKHLESTAANIDELYRRGKNSWVKDIVQAVTGV